MHFALALVASQCKAKSIRLPCFLFLGIIKVVFAINNIKRISFFFYNLVVYVFAVIIVEKSNQTQLVLNSYPWVAAINCKIKQIGIDYPID